MTEPDKPKPNSVSAKPNSVTPAFPPDWLTAQAKAATTARPRKPRAAYKRRWP
jgi:hypothetical protein